MSTSGDPRPKVPNMAASPPWIPDWTIVLVMAIALVFVIEAWPMNPYARQFPMLAGVSCLLLGALELVSQFLRHRADAAAGRSQSRPAPDSEDRAQSVKIVVWLFLSVLSIYPLGILGTSFLSTMIFYWLLDDRRPSVSVLLGAIVATFMWLSFSYLAGFQLYHGFILKELLP